MLRLKNVRTSGVRIKMAIGANVARERPPQNLERRKIRGLITFIPVLGKHSSVSYIPVSSRCHGACSRTDDRGQSCGRGLCCPVNCIVILEISTCVLCILKLNTSKYMEDNIAHVVPAITKSDLHQFLSHTRPRSR